MASSRYRRASIMPRRRPNYDWIRQVYQPTLNATLMNVDLFGGFRTAAGITINLPEITIWRIRLSISIRVTIAAALAANDAVHVTAFTSGQARTPLNQVSSPLDQQDMWWDTIYLTEGLMTGSGTPDPGSFYIYKQYDIKARRRFKSAQDTVFLQLASSGQVQIADVSLSQSILFTRR